VRRISCQMSKLLLARKRQTNLQEDCVHLSAPLFSLAPVPQFCQTNNQQCCTKSNNETDLSRLLLSFSKQKLGTRTDRCSLRPMVVSHSISEAPRLPFASSVFMMEKPNGRLLFGPSSSEDEGAEMRERESGNSLLLAGPSLSGGCCSAFACGCGDEYLEEDCESLAARLAGTNPTKECCFLFVCLSSSSIQSAAIQLGPLGTLLALCQFEVCKR